MNPWRINPLTRLAAPLRPRSLAPLPPPVLMENYRKASTVEEPVACPFPDLPPDTPQVLVRDGSKIRNILGFALSRLEAPAAAHKEATRGAPDAGPPATAEPQAPARPPCRQMVFTAAGKGISKAITCTEIVKRRMGGSGGGGGVHQCTELRFHAVRDLWEPLEPAAGLEGLTVSRNIPAVWILLSRDPLDPGRPGYQAPGTSDGLWAHASPQEEERGGGGGGRGGQSGGARRKRGAVGERGGGGRGRGRGRPPGNRRGLVRGQSHG